MSKRKKPRKGTLRWRCTICGAVQESRNDPIALAESGPLMCPECVDREMSPCETDLQPVLDALGRCAFVLFKITTGDPKALRNAGEVVRASVKLLEEYGEQDEWMEQTHHE